MNKLSKYTRDPEKHSPAAARGRRKPSITSYPIRGKSASLRMALPPSYLVTLL